MATERPRRARRTHAAMSEATRAALLTRARAAFARDGFAGAPIDEVVAAAGLTKGAVYHHFGSKLGLFEAVVRDAYRELGARVPEVQAGDDGWDELVAGCRTYLEGLLDPALRRILLVEAPAVLGTERERELADELSGRPLRIALDQLHAAGLLVEDDREALARLLGGALTEIALWMGETRQPRVALTRGLAMLTRLLAPLRPGPARRR